MERLIGETSSLVSLVLFLNGTQMKRRFCLTCSNCHRRLHQILNKTLNAPNFNKKRVLEEISAESAWVGNMKIFSDKLKETLFCHKGANFLVEFQKFHENFVCFCQTKALNCFFKFYFSNFLWERIFK
jgi:hypothetical protein